MSCAALVFPSSVHPVAKRKPGPTLTRQLLLGGANFDHKSVLDISLCQAASQGDLCHSVCRSSGETSFLLLTEHVLLTIVIPLKIFM